MDSTKHQCKHINEIIDQRQGDIVCTDCGLVLSAVYISNYNNSTLNYFESNEYDYVLEILSRLNLPKYFATNIMCALENFNTKEKKKEDMLAFVIYKQLNDLGCTVTLKEINSVTGFTNTQIYNMQGANETIVIDPAVSIEKYCALAGLPKKSYAVIKEKIHLRQKTGHNPTTVIGGEIFKYCRENKIAISIEKLSEILNISPISIRRYSKKNES